MKTDEEIRREVLIELFKRESGWDNLEGAEIDGDIDALNDEYGNIIDLAIQKTRADLLAEIKGWLQEIRGSEDDSLNRMPIEISAKIQSGFLLGYADCWNKVLKRVVETEGKEAKQ